MGAPIPPAVLPRDIISCKCGRINEPHAKYCGACGQPSSTFIRISPNLSRCCGGRCEKARLSDSLKTGGRNERPQGFRPIPPPAPPPPPRWITK
jgi:hypothetical protein